MTPDLIQVVDVLTQEQVDVVIASITNEDYEPATVFGTEGKTIVDTSVRSNRRFCVPETHLAATIMHEGVNAALLTYRDRLTEAHHGWNKYPVPGGWNNTCWREAFQVLKYEVKEEYQWHVDTGTYKSEQAYYRSISVVLYLQSATVGGRTVFPHQAYQPKAGQALIFPSNWCFPHSAEPVEEGTKMVAVTWYHSDYQ